MKREYIEIRYDLGYGWLAFRRHAERETITGHFQPYDGSAYHNSAALVPGGSVDMEGLNLLLAYAARPTGTTDAERIEALWAVDMLLGLSPDLRGRKTGKLKPKTKGATMYNYEAEKPKLFTEEGQVTFLEIRDRTHRLIAKSGAVQMGKAIAGSTGDSWLMLACVDRMVELDELEELTTPGETAGRHRVFVAG